MLLPAKGGGGGGDVGSCKVCRIDTGRNKADYHIVDAAAKLTATIPSEHQFGIGGHPVQVGGALHHGANVIVVGLNCREGIVVHVSVSDVSQSEFTV